ncbi:MAG: hypothetical protein QXW31_01580 [Nitrososphaerota archaeon]
MNLEQIIGIAILIFLHFCVQVLRLTVKSYLTGLIEEKYKTRHGNYCYSIVKLDEGYVWMML